MMIPYALAPPASADEVDSLVAVPGDMTTLVVHCSDGRFGNQCDRFVRGRLEQRMYDRLIVPGGSAWLAGRPDLDREATSARNALHLLVDAHRLSHIVCIAHAGCAFYLQKLRVPPERCESRQRGDLLAVAHWLRESLPHVQLSAYYARRNGARVVFDPVFGARRDLIEPVPKPRSFPPWRTLSPSSPQLCTIAP